MEIETPSPEVASPLGPDLLSGAEEIAGYLDEPVRRIRWMLEKGDLPAFKLRGRWYCRKTKLHEMIERLETGVNNESPTGL